MEFDITPDKGTVILTLSRKTLQEKIIEVSKKTGLVVKDTKWVIFDAKTRRPNYFGFDLPVLISPSGADYGFCYPCKNEIWISTLAIERTPLTSINDKVLTGLTGLPMPKKRDFLAEVIIHELIHIEIKKGHDTQEFISREQSCFEKLYSGIVKGMR